ncbi:hypothetical protein MKQ68_13320 [Chitinophaga horti]|uniref:Uncharacterized protein n=1 Tax=Chitinophaga horti TaxID=2920382 RepID=A0ABY6IUN0_9BACT|nr:hypothetical protein [Chitinophaga horti]UYQ91073.1 hypothetical protein MKQ68_13320 [Chitinophaga horti]
MKKLILLLSLALFTGSAFAQFDNDGNFMRIRPGVTNYTIDNATANGMYGVTHFHPTTGLPEHQSALLTFYSGGSTGPLQLEATYWGQLAFRNKTDNTTWQPWKTIWHSGNFTPGNYLKNVVDTWGTDNGGQNRLYFESRTASTGTTYFQGYGDKPFEFYNGAGETIMVIGSTGNVGFGGLPRTDYKLTVGGPIIATKVKVTATPWADFVFRKEYQLPSIAEVETYIKTHGHLPGIPSEVEVQKEGIDLAEINAKLLQKIEELTLYMIDQHKKIEILQQEVITLKKAL